MEFKGDIGKLKKEIESLYSDKLKQFEKELNQQYEEEEKTIKESHEKEIKKARAEMNELKDKTYRSKLAEEILNAKKGYEQKREELIEETFRKAKEESKDLLLSQEYIDNIKKNMDKASSIIGSFEEYKKDFPEIEIDPKINGIQIKKQRKTLDFTFDRFIESQKLQLRHEISSILFKNVK